MAIEFDEFLDVLSNDHLLPENVWHKFLFDEQIQSLPMVETVVDTSNPRNCEVVKNDFMWSGNGTTFKSVQALPPGDARQTPVAQVEPGAQQSLLKPELRISVDPHTVVPMMASAIHLTMQTPPISDDEESQPTPILESLNWALLTNDLDDGELSDYFKDDGKDWGFFDDELDDDLLHEEEEEKPEVEDAKPDVKPTAEELAAKQRENEMRAFYAANDHSYHKGFSASPNFGLETPSDSEEEIDVVSLNDKFTSSSALPTNPTNRDRRQIQRTMQSRFPEGVKGARAAPEAKKAAEGKKTPDGRGRGRQNKRSGRKPAELKPMDIMDKRDLHNNMERLRRIGLRNLFYNLVYATNPHDPNYKIAKVRVLQQAKEAIKKLIKERQRLRLKAAKLRERREHLTLRLERLKQEAEQGARRRGRYKS